MPAKRRPGKVKDYRITPAVIAAWKAGDTLALHRALGLRPWQCSPLEVEGECPWSPSGKWGDWAAMVDLRAALIEAAAAE